jgi:hypothetical protein
MMRPPRRDVRLAKAHGRRNPGARLPLRDRSAAGAAERYSAFQKIVVSQKRPSGKSA